MNTRTIKAFAFALAALFTAASHAQAAQPQVRSRWATMGQSTIRANDLGASTSDATGNTNTTAIQNALNIANARGGGVVSVEAPGTYLISGVLRDDTSTINYTLDSALVIYSNTTLILGDGVTLKLASGSYCYMLRNAAGVRSTPIYATDCTYTASTHTITKTAAFSTVSAGQWVLLTNGTQGRGLPLVDSASGAMGSSGTTITLTGAFTDSANIVAGTKVVIYNGASAGTKTVSSRADNVLTITPATADANGTLVAFQVPVGRNGYYKVASATADTIVLETPAYADRDFCAYDLAAGVLVTNQQARDSNITVVGGTWDGNGSGHTSNPNLRWFEDGIWFHGCDNVTYSGLTLINFRKYAISITGCTSTRGYDLVANTGSAVVQFDGGNLESHIIKGLRGYWNDTGIAVVTSEGDQWASGSFVSGGYRPVHSPAEPSLDSVWAPCGHFVFEDIRGEGVAAYCGPVAGSDSRSGTGTSSRDLYIESVTVRNCSGKIGPTYLNGVVWVYDDPHYPSQPITGGTHRQLTVENIDVTGQPTGNLVKLDAIGLKSATIRGIRSCFPNCTPVRIGTTCTANLDQVEIDGLVDTAAGRGSIIWEGVCNRLTVSNSRFVLPDYGNALRFVSGATCTDSWQFVNCHFSGATGGSGNNRYAFLDAANITSKGGFTNCQFKSIGAAWYELGTLEIGLTGCRFDSCTLYGENQGSSKSCIITGSGCTGTANNGLYTAGTMTTVRLRNPSLSVYATSRIAGTPLTGDTFENTQAGFVVGKQAGLVLYTNGAWVAVGQ